MKGHVWTMSLIKKSVLWNCVLQVQLYISLPDTIFDEFLQNHSLVPLTICTLNHKRWYNFSTRHSRETLLQGNTKDVEKYIEKCILAALKILKIGVQI